MDGNGGIVGIKNAGQSGRWNVGDVFLDRNGIRIPLLHRWPLISDAIDAVGDLDLTNNGTVTFSANGASFNGSSQWLSGALAKPDAWTMSAWVQTNNVSSRHCPAICMDNIGTSQTAWGLGFNYDVSPLSTMRYMAAIPESPYELTVANEFTAEHYPPGSKVFVAVTFDGEYVKAYRDNTLLGSLTGVAFGVGHTGFAIGRMGDLALGYWYGTIADVRVYSAALSAIEVSELYAAGPNP